MKLKTSVVSQTFKYVKNEKNEDLNIPIEVKV